MRIEKVGKLPVTVNETPAPPWWLGRRIECKRCFTMVSLTAKDAPFEWDSFTLPCPLPGCGGTLDIRPVYDRSGMIQ